MVGPSGRTVLSRTVTVSGLGAGATASVELEGGGELPRGLYEVTAEASIAGAPGSANIELRAATGFWSYDLSMLRGGDALVAGPDGFTRRGLPFPVLGTTYMASDVHRRFLLEPNALVWNRDFAAMKDAGVNLVRTGLWTGWKRYMPGAGRVQEGALRALDVFLLTARRHDLPVIFNLFAFLPEAWGGENPYLDPRAVSAQQAFLGVLGERYAGADDLAWDLINEPSFSAAAHLWKTRPNGDPAEQAAWDGWLRTRYGADRAGYGAAARRAWGAAPDERLGVPSPDDFADRNLFGTFRPLKAADYKRFSQDMFAEWVAQMTAALRANGNRAQLITVGQDEGGLSERPSPLLFGHRVDFTCVHTWWYNDAQPWDSVLARLPDRPMLVEETGMMRYERMDGSSWRSEQDAAALLERKLAMAVGSGSSGYVQWIWNTNPYMPSDNEAGIGFFRADGTARPELAPFIEVSRFLARHAGRLTGRAAEEVAILVPQSQLFSPRSQALEATQRAVRVLTNHLGIVPRAINELRAAETTGAPRLIIAPAPRLLTESAWQALLRAVDQGATLLLTGVIDADENGRPANRTDIFGLTVTDRPVAGEEPLVLDGSAPLSRLPGRQAGTRADRGGLGRAPTDRAPDRPRSRNDLLGAAAGRVGRGARGHRLALPDGPGRRPGDTASEDRTARSGGVRKLDDVRRCGAGDARFGVVAGCRGHRVAAGQPGHQRAGARRPRGVAAVGQTDWGGGGPDTVTPALGLLPAACCRPPPNRLLSPISSTLFRSVRAPRTKSVSGTPG